MRRTDRADARCPHPAGALEPAAEEALFAKLTDMLILNEGADPSNPQVRSIAWLFVHRAEIRESLGAAQRRSSPNPPGFPDR